MRSRVTRIILFAPLFVVGAALFITLGGMVVKLLWNWLLPPLFGWPLLTFWQALALLALCRILFGGFSMRSSGGSRWRQRMRERCENMTPEERERFRQRTREHWGFDPAPPAESKG